MPSNPTYKQFLVEEFPSRIEALKTSDQPSFGIMTPQHMVEHLILMAKLSTRQYGDVNSPATEGQIKFKKFIDNGANFEHRPSDKTADDLPKLKYGSLQEAKDDYANAIDRFYNHFEAQPDYLSYNQIQGALGFEDLEFLHYRHFQYHLDQFGL